MKVKCINAASRKTKEAIRREFLTQLNDKHELSKITVTSLVNNIGITRGAFYSHYDNIYEVAKDFQDDTLEILNEKMIINSADDINNCFDEIVSYLKENEDIYKMILKSNDPLLFSNQLNKVVYRKLYGLLKDNTTNQNNLELSIAFFTDGCISLLIKHYRKEISFSLDEINEYMKTTFKNMFFKSC